MHAPPSSVGAAGDHPEVLEATAIQPTRQEEWELLFSAIAVAFTADASIGLVFALVCCGGAQLLAFVFGGSSCDGGTRLVTLLILCIRGLDVTLGLCGLVACGRNPTDRPHFLMHISVGSSICFTQLILGIALIIVSILLVGGGDCMATGILNILSGVAVSVLASKEVGQWTFAAWLWYISARDPIPRSLQGRVPAFLARLINPRT